MVNKIIFCVMVLVFGAVAQIALADSSTPEGKWMQIDEKTNQPHSIIQIYARDGVLFGKVLKGFPLNGNPPREFCDMCQGDLHNKPMVGLVIMQNFMQTSSDVWGNGTIIDPDSGSIYRCKLTLLNGGSELRVRGYVGAPIFGRSQVWHRLAS